MSEHGFPLQQPQVAVFGFSLGTRNFVLGTAFAANKAAAEQSRKMATISPVAATKLPIVPQQRQSPSLLPRLRHYGGCSRVSRRFLWRKIRKSAALPVLAAIHFGSKFAQIDKRLQ